jgi:phosphoenolpyruvate-protein kinase (PTS system EI component)
LKERIGSVSLPECRTLAKQALQADSAADVRALAAAAFPRAAAVSL